MNNYNFNIIGAGAIGHLWACFLKQHGVRATLHSRNSLKSQLIDIDSPLLRFVHDIEYQTLDHWVDADVIIICVKAFELEKLCQTLVNHVKNGSPVILMMNGMGLVEIVEKYLPSNPVIHASLVHGAYLDGQLLRHTGQGVTLLGDLQGQQQERIFKPIVEILNLSLPDARWNSGHQQTMNLKLVINAIINPVTAIKRISNGAIIRGKCLIEEAESLLQELRPLISDMLPDYTLSEIRDEVIQVAQNTAKNQSSMLRDVQLHRWTEIDFINGYLTKLAEEKSIYLREHSQIIAKINQLTR